MVKNTDESTVTDYLYLCTVIFETTSTFLATFQGLRNIPVDGTWKFYQKGLGPGIQIGPEGGLRPDQLSALYRFFGLQDPSQQSYSSLATPYGGHSHDKYGTS